MQNYEYRPQQLAMAKAIEKAIQTDRHLIAEAGTGVGKSFAYLVPAILDSVQRANLEKGSDRKEKSKPIIVSTHTISLQEQLITKDIPFLNSVLPLEFSAILVKGRRNYVSLRRMESAWNRSTSLFSKLEETDQIRTLKDWANETDDGTLADLISNPWPPFGTRLSATVEIAWAKSATSSRTVFITKRDEGCKMHRFSSSITHFFLPTLLCENRA